MARVELASLGVGVAQDVAGNVQAGRAVTINTTVYAAATGGTTISPVLTQNDGTIPGWVEEGTYTVTVGGVTRTVEATSAATIAVLREAPLNAGLSTFGLVGDGVADDTTGLQAFIDAVATPSTGRGRGFIPPGRYKHDDLQAPSTLGNAGGMTISGAGPYLTRLEYSGNGYGITLGDSGTYSTNFQFLEDLELIGNANALGAVLFNYARWCEVRRCYIHGFTNASAEAISVTAADHNYFNHIAGCWFATNTRHIALHGDPSGVGANSNFVHHNVFNPASGDAMVVIDGGDTNRVSDNEFDGAQAVAVKILGTAIYNTLERNQFDGPTKGWDLGANVSFSQLIDNTGAASILNTSTDAGTANSRRDIYTQQARVSAYTVAGQSIANNDFPFAVIGWTGEEYDPVGMHDNVTNNDRLTVAVPGVYHVDLRIQWAANATGIRMCRVVKNAGATTIAEDDQDPPADGTSPCIQTVSFDHEFAADDYIRCQVYQLSGGSLAVTGGTTAPGSRFQMHRIA